MGFRMRNAALKEDVLAILERAAEKGERCPTNPQIASALSRPGRHVAASTVPGTISDLIRDGKIAVAFFNQKTRAVTICEGASAGKRTSLPEVYGKPAWVIDRGERERRDIASTERAKERTVQKRLLRRP